MMPFVTVALKVCELMEIADKQGQGIVMRFAKLYSVDKMKTIVDQAKTYPWWNQNPKAAFMKAVGVVNKNEKSVKDN